MKGQAVSYAYNTLSPHRSLVGNRSLRPHKPEQAVGDARPIFCLRNMACTPARTEKMQGVMRPQIQVFCLVAGGQMHVAQNGSGPGSGSAGMQVPFQIRIHRTCPHVPYSVTGVCQSDIQLFGMSPPKSRKSIAPGIQIVIVGVDVFVQRSEIAVVLSLEFSSLPVIPVQVTSVVDRKRQLVGRRQVAVEASAEVVEPKVGRRIQAQQKRLGKHGVENSPAEGKARKAVYRTVKMQFACQQARRHAAPQGSAVAFGARYADHRGRAAAITCREVPLIKGYPAHRFGRKNGKQAQQVVGIVHRNSVQKDKVFVGISAPDADAAESLGRSLYAWKHLERLKHILLPEQDRRLKHR